MEATIVLAGGFYGISRKSEIWGHTPNVMLGEKDRGIDFIIDIKGLPAELLAPEGLKVSYKWYCEKCQRIVPEWEMERRVGCANHDPKPEKKETPEWRTGILEAYNLPRLNIETIRIWLDSTPGREKWENIVRCIKSKLPASKRLDSFTPKPLGTRGEFTITKDEIPVLDLTNYEMLKTPRQEVEELKNELRAEIADVKNMKQQYERRVDKGEAANEKWQLKKRKCHYEGCGKIYNNYQSWYVHQQVHKKKGDGLKEEFKTVRVGDEETKDVGSSTSNDNTNTNS